MEGVIRTEQTIQASWALWQEDDSQDDAVKWLPHEAFRDAVRLLIDTTPAMIFKELVLTIAWAASHGQLHWLEWARARSSGELWEPWVCARAAEKGDLIVLKWLRDLHPPCPWNEFAC